MHAATGGERVVAGRYLLAGRIGRGAMGTVWQARDPVLARDVAIKEIKVPELLTSQEREVLQERSLREARAAARLNHPGVVTVFDVVEADGNLWIVMELVPARSLEQILAVDGPLPPQQAAEVGTMLLGALACAHTAGIMHRDVKPSNVLLSKEGRAVLTDFGIATLEGDPGLTQTGMVMGTPGFSAPERIRGEPATPSSDLWSLGATLYAAAEGHGPFSDRSTPMAVLAAVANEDAPPARHAGPLSPLIEALLQRDPGQRPDTGTALRLLGAVTGGQEPAPGRAPAISAAPAAGAADLLSAPPPASALASPPPAVAAPERLATARNPDRMPAGRLAAGRLADSLAADRLTAGRAADSLAADRLAAARAADPLAADRLTAGRAADRAAAGRAAGAVAAVPGRPMAGPPAGPGHAGTRVSTGSRAGLSRATAAGQTRQHARPGAGVPGRRARPRRSWALLVAAAGLAGAGLLISFLLLLATRSSGRPARNRGGAPGAAGQPRRLPRGYRWLSVPGPSAGTAGFSVAVPESWQTYRRGRVTTVQAPTGPLSLSVRREPAGMTDMQALARMLRRRELAAAALAGYRPGPQRTHRLAGRLVISWTLHWDKPGTGRAPMQDVVFTVGTPAGRQPYRLRLTAPLVDWHAGQAVLAEAVRTFRAAS